MKIRDILFAILLLFTFACSSNSSNEDPAHEAAETPTVDTTIWTNKLELFVEFPALVVNNTSRFAAHFTVLENHQPVREGAVTVSLVKDGKGIQNTAESPSSPGIFTPSLQPTEAGIYQLVFDIQTPAFRDSIVINKVQVFANAEEAGNELESKENAAKENAAGVISFLKEQAWKMEFQTAPVIKGEIYDVINTSGVWKAAPGAKITLSANTTGVVGFALDKLTEGTAVKKGQLLMTISSKGLTSNNLQAEIEQARANFEQAQAEYDRKKQLYESKIVPKAEFEQVENRFRVAKSAYETLRAGYSTGGKEVRAPFDGFVRSINTGNGEYVAQGMGLLTVGTYQSRLLEIHVSPSYAPVLSSINNIRYQTGNGKWSGIKESGGSVLAVGKEVENDQPLIPIYAQVNEEVQMPDGSFTEVQLSVGSGDHRLLVPEAALLENYGDYSVMVQLSGESFESRPVRIGRRNGDYVEVLQGLQAGEVVVIKGAYQVKMASMSGQTPGHGHEH